MLRVFLFFEEGFRKGFVSPTAENRRRNRRPDSECREICHQFACGRFLFTSASVKNGGGKDNDAQIQRALAFWKNKRTHNEKFLLKIRISRLPLRFLSEFEKTLRTKTSNYVKVVFSLLFKDRYIWNKSYYIYIITEIKLRTSKKHKKTQKKYENTLFFIWQAIYFCDKINKLRNRGLTRKVTEKTENLQPTQRRRERRDRTKFNAVSGERWSRQSNRRRCGHGKLCLLY